ncbi:MAG: serine/threonine-protein kinase [Planctomycetota bacterium]|nr:serine/threonine-protein kinase [Planctomycetota bacterium]
MNPKPAAEKLDDLLDRIVAEYQDRLASGSEPPLAEYLQRAPAEHRPALERSLRMILAGRASAPRASRVLVPGVTLGAYKLVREIGRGGMAIVFHATQIDLRRSVALKVLRPGLAVEKSHVERFQREALAIARLQHPHIVQVHAVGETDGWHWIAMEYVEGRNLAQIYVEMARVEPDPARWTAEMLSTAAGIPHAAFSGLSYAQALAKLLAPVARAIGVAHEIGLVHRDVKPSNILVHKDGRALIADFGLAKGDGDPALSMSGEPVGTPYYMSPEQALLAHTPIDRRTDVYSLGVTLYEGLAGRRPFEGTSTFAVLDAIRAHNPEPLTRHLPKISRDVDAVVEVAMAKEPGERYANAFDLAHDLDEIASGGVTQAASRRGGEWARLLRAWKSAQMGHTTEFRTRAQLLGWPLVHFHLGRRVPGTKPRTARGWLAMGERAIGLFAFGGTALGGFAFGGMCCGLVGFGGLAGGLFAWGGVAVGVVAWGGLAIGYFAMGGVAVGIYAIGGKSIGAIMSGAGTEMGPAVRDALRRLFG